MFGALIALALVAGTPPATAEILPNAGLTTVLGNTTLSVYYQPTPAGFRVVATAGSGDPQNIVRFVGTLAAGQDMIVSVPRGVGEAAIDLLLQRNGEHLQMTLTKP